VILPLLLLLLALIAWPTLNTLPLNPYTVVDLQLSRPITKWGEIFLAFENILDETYAVQRTTDAIVTTGGPRQIRGGVRLTY